MKTDTLFYRLFQADPSLALELAGLAVPEPERYRFGSHEIKQTAFRLDGVLEPPAERPDAPVVFTEVQFQPDEGFYLRFFSEVLLYLRQYRPGHPWRAVVFYPDTTAERLDGLSAPLTGLPNLRRVFLSELPLLDSPNPKLWLIALILAREPDIPAIVRRVRGHGRQHPDENIDWLDLLETLLVYKLPKLTREEIQAMLELKDIDLKNTRFYQQVFGEGRTEGRTEGRMEGRAEGEAALLLHLMERRFGPLSEEVRRRISEADAETLLVWGERILDAETPDDLWTH